MDEIAEEEDDANFYDAMPKDGLSKASKSNKRTEVLSSFRSNGDSMKVSYKGLTKREKVMMVKADEEEAPVVAEEQRILDTYKKKSFASKLSPHTKPRIAVVSGLIASIVQGSIFPIFAIFIMKEIFILGDYKAVGILYTKSKLNEESDTQCMYMAIASVVILFSGFSQKYSFGVVGENITLAMRSRLYKGYLTKHIGWFDNRDNAPGILTSALANDASILNGASTEGLAVIMEAGFAILVGMIISFIYDWKIALVALACTPFMAAGAAINARF